MRIAATFFLACAIACASFGQSPEPKWQVATLLAVQAHPPAAEEDPSLVRYDVTLKVGNTEYIVLYTPPDGTLRDIAQYRLGRDGLVLIGSQTIQYNDMLGRTREVPILSRRTLPPKTQK